jgi:hypothetical protein
MRLMPWIRVGVQFIGTEKILYLVHSQAEEMTILEIKLINQYYNVNLIVIRTHYKFAILLYTTKREV